MSNNLEKFILVDSVGFCQGVEIKKIEQKLKI